MRLALASIMLAAPLLAQQATTNPPESRADRFMRYCEDSDGRDRETFCEVRDQTLRAPSGTLRIDGHPNGSVRVFGWDRSEVLVRALIQASAESVSDARSIASDVRIEAAGDRIRTDGPSYRRRSHWSVSYEIWVPRKTSLDAETSNGSVAVSGVEGRIELRADNGSITLRDVAGDVRGRTSNGSINAQLSGTAWQGAGLDLTTTNGSVNLDIPKGFNAILETGTVNGGLSIDFPITVRGTIGRRITTTLGSGGPRLRAVTTNGAVRIKEL